MAQLMPMVAEIQAAAEKLRASASDGDRFLGELLRLALEIPDQGAIRLRDGVPVLAPWGHMAAGPGGVRELLVKMVPTPVAPMAMVGPPPPPPPRPRESGPGARGPAAAPGAAARAVPALARPLRLVRNARGAMRRNAHAGRHARPVARGGSARGHAACRARPYLRRGRRAPPAVSPAAAAAAPARTRAAAAPAGPARRGRPRSPRHRRRHPSRRAATTSSAPTDRARGAAARR